jgi:hypothetical protein
MNRVYQIQNPDGTSFGLFNSTWRAQNRIDEMNLNRVTHLMIQSHRLTGIKRGKNVEKWNDLVKQIAEPFYTIKELIVQ